VAQLRQIKSRFDKYGAKILLVGSGDLQQAEIFRQTYATEFDVASDNQRLLYQAYRLKRTSLFQMASPSLFLKGLRTIGRGHGLGSAQGDVFQLPGVFIIDTKGMVRYSYHGRDPADRPKPKALLSVLAEIQESSNP
jgi:peroxiredoxin